MVLGRAPDGSIRYGLLRGAGPRLGDAETAPAYETFDALDVAVADIVSGRGGEEVGVLADHAVQYLLVAAPVDEDLVAKVDAVPGLRRLSTDDESALWSLSEPTARLRVLDRDGAQLALLPSARVGALTELENGPAGRVVVLAEIADPRWRATLDGVELIATEVDGWAQAWTVPAGSGQLRVEYDGADRSRWLLVQIGLLGLVVLLALPAARRSEVTP